MKRIAFTFLIFFYAQLAFSQNDSLKYLHHNNYETFIQFLRDSTQKLNTEIEKLVFIRRKAAELIDIGAGGKDVSLMSSNWANFRAKEYYHLFYHNKATVRCGGASFFLQKIYIELGYESEIYDMGCSGEYTHQVTIVKCKKSDDYYVQDAFHNVSFYDKKTKEYIQMSKMIALLQNKKHRKIKIDYDTYETYTWDTTGLNQTLKQNGFKSKFNGLKVKRLMGMNRKQFIKASRNYNKRLKECLKENELPMKHIYIYLLPLDHNKPKMIKLINRLKKGGLKE